MTNGDHPTWQELPIDVNAVSFVVRSDQSERGFDTVQEATDAFNSIQSEYGRYCGHLAIDTGNESGYILFVRSHRDSRSDDGAAG
jgi:hypothetical protein